MSKEIKKRDIIIGISELSESYINFLNLKYNIKKAYSFKELKVNNKLLLEVDLLLFTGGADVSPSYYSEYKGKYTSCNAVRDRLEYDIINNHYSYRIPKLGICRGAQFLTVMSRGSLIQHVTGHTANHNISFDLNFINGSFLDLYYEEGYVNDNYINLIGTSTHHQMMNPTLIPKSDYEVIAFSTQFRSTTYLDGGNKEIKLPKEFVEPEIIYYNRKNALAIQYHPEFDNATDKLKELTLNIIENKLLKIEK